VKRTKLRKHLKGESLRLIDDSYKIYKDASAAMIRYFGNAHETWRKTRDEFVKNHKNIKAWQAKGTSARRGVIAGTCAFLRQAEKFASYSGDLDRVVNSIETINVLITVIPEDVKKDAFKRSYEEHLKSGTADKEIPVSMKMKYIRIMLEAEHNLAQ
jgi:hypothetical protein